MTADTGDTAELRKWLDAATIDSAVAELRPDYRALLVVADGLRPGPGDEFSESLLAAAEAGAGSDPDAHPHVAAWQEAFRSFGAKPQRVRPSVDALMRRAPGGLPRIDRLTDIYNAVSVAHVLPIGGEDLDRYAGHARLVRADGTERFDVVSGGAEAIEHPRPGEVVWRDDMGVTCRRWNWRQCVRTRLTDRTTRAVFILDALDPMSDDALASAGEALAGSLASAGPRVRVATRLVRAGAPQG